jgi:hypothetical protein
LHRCEGRDASVEVGGEAVPVIGVRASDCDVIVERTRDRLERRPAVWRSASHMYVSHRSMRAIPAGTTGSSDAATSNGLRTQMM